MGLVVSEGGERKDAPLMEAGLKRAVCCNVVDLGSHLNTYYDKMQRTVRLTWELADERSDITVDEVEKNVPRLIGKKYTLSLSKNSNLRKDLKSWRGRDFTADELKAFDLANLVGVPCLLNVDVYTDSTGKERNGVNGATPLMKGQEVPSAEGDVFYYSIDEHGKTFPEAMPDWMRDIVMESEEIAGVKFSASEPPVTDPPDVGGELGLDEDIPF